MLKINISDIFKARDDFCEREENIDPHEYRSPFERDRDRILYSKEFRRLSGKTQIFVAGFDDHMRTRLTHTLEVAQIAETIAKAVGVNEMLCNAIALGHDVGHTPFGHVGERTLNHIMNGCEIIKDFNVNLADNEKGFKHNLQGIRVLSSLEEISPDYDGLNLTKQTLWGVLNHTKLSYGRCKNGNKDKNKCNLKHIHEKECLKDDQSYSLGFYLSADKSDNLNKYNNNKYWSIEAIIVNWADEIAQRHHDIEDGLRANIIAKEEILESKTLQGLRDSFKRNKKHKRILELIDKNKENKTIVIPLMSKLIVDLLVSDVIDNLKMKLSELSDDYNLNNYEDFFENKEKIISEIGMPKLKETLGFSEELKTAQDALEKFLEDRIINSHMAQSMDGKSNYIIRKLFAAYLTNPQQLPDSTIITLYRNLNHIKYIKNSEKDKKMLVGELRKQLNNDHFEENKDNYRSWLLRTVCDYIAGMTDQYALDQYDLLYGTSNFGKF